MNAIVLLTKDHEMVRGLFRDIKSTSTGAVKHRQELAERIYKALEIHTKIEQEIFYPAVRTAAIDNVNVVTEAEAEHRAIDEVLSLLRGLSPDNPEYDGKLQALIDNVEHHAAEEENEMFPAAERTLGNQLEVLGLEMGERKAVLEESYESTLSGALRQAKTLVARAFNALTPSDQNGATKPKRRTPRQRTARVSAKRATRPTSKRAAARPRPKRGAQAVASRKKKAAPARKTARSAR